MEHKTKTIYYPKEIHPILLEKAAKNAGGNLNKYIRDLLVEDSKKK